MKENPVLEDWEEIVPGTRNSKYKGPGVEMGSPCSNKKQANGPGELPRPEEKWAGTRLKPFL